MREPRQRTWRRRSCALYELRDAVERFFCRLKRFRRIATHCDKLDCVFLAFIHLALIYDALQLTSTGPS